MKSKGIRVLIVVVLSLVLATGFVLISSPTVRAVPPNPTAAPPGVSPHSGSTCPAGYICLFRDYEYSGPGYKVQAGKAARWFGDFNFNDQMSSWANDSGITFCWFTDADYRGQVHDMKPGYRVNVLPNENDQASSLRPC